MFRFILTSLLLLLLCACTTAPGGSLNNAVNVNEGGAVPETPFTIHDSSDLIGGPLATGRVGDILLENDKIKVIIEQPGKTPWVGNFGGTIVDADLIRGGGAGQDNFGFMQPLVNIEWTLNVFDYEVVDQGTDGGAKIFRTYGVVDVYDYLDIDFISPVAKSMVDQTLHFEPRFDDVNDPFNLTDLANLNRTVVTDYTLEPGKNYVKIDTTFENMGDADLFLPVGEFVNGSGEVMFLIPGLGFTPEMMSQIQGETPALIYVGFENSGVSYGYFYDLHQFVEKDEDGYETRLKTTSLSYSGVTGILFGEEFLKVLPLGSQSKSKVNFSIPAHGSRTITRYFVVGDGGGGSVFDAGLKALGIATNPVSGIVKDSNGSPIAGATVAVKNESDATVITYRTDSRGAFSGELSAGYSEFDKAFGSGKYTLSVYKRGYGGVGNSETGTCDPEEINIAMGPVAGVECELGGSGTVKVTGGVTDEDSGEKIPARMTVVGYMPTLRSETGGHFEDKIIFERPLGVVDVFYINAKGTIGLEGLESIRLAPGRYELVFTRGVEYSMVRIPVDVSGGAVVSVGPVALKKVIDTSGFVSADFHLHSIVSPDSAMRPERRVLAAAGEGMDMLHSSDHDYLVDYEPYLSRLASDGLIKSGSMKAIVGDEISPNHIGHLNVFPLEYHGDKPCGGALDWSYTPSDIAGPEPDLVMSPQDVVDYVRGLPGEHIIQINHIADAPTSILTLGGWVTTPVYYDDFGVEPLSGYGDPVMNRLEPHASAANYPYPMGSSEMVVTDVDTVELNIGPWLHDNFFLTSSLPEWFNLLNLGLIYTATSDSDSHREISNPVGIPRNFIVSKEDPADGKGSFSNFNEDEYVRAIRDHRLIVTTGPFIKATAGNGSGSTAAIGEIIEGGQIKLSIDVTSPEWAWFDTVEIYTNTEPVPASDENLIPLEDEAKNPDTFFEPYHVRRYYYKPDHIFSLSDGTLKDWKNEDGVISAHLDFDLSPERDTWIVVFVKGTEGTEGYKSLFPFVTHALVDADNPSAEPVEADYQNVDMLSLKGAAAWAFTNPIFVDVDGDGFDAIHSEWGFSKALKTAKTSRVIDPSSRASVRRSSGVSGTYSTEKPATGVNTELLR